MFLPSSRLLMLVVTVLIFLIPQAGISAEKNMDKENWEKFGVNAGLFVSNIDSNFRIGTGIGVDIDVEDLLGLDTTNTVFRTDLLWRFSGNRRHRLDLTWFSFRRNGVRTIIEDIVIEDPDTGEEITIDAGTRVEGFFNFDIFELAYSYSFIQDDRIDLAALIGVYVMPMDIGITVSGLVEDQGKENFTAPLPSLGFRMDVALTPKWFIRTKTQLFYLELDRFKGGLLEFTGALEYNPWRHVGIGLGFDSFAMKLEADGEDWPGIDFKGKVTFHYSGFQLYLRYFF